jgi:hypothetical protein
MTSLDPATCELFQATDLTMFNCQKTFELYNTEKLASDPYSLNNYGESRTVVGASTSFETSEEAGRLTYIALNRDLIEASVDKDGEVVKSTIMKIDAKN